jgi:hypothetical protein
MSVGESSSQQVIGTQFDYSYALKNDGFQNGSGRLSLGLANGGATTGPDAIWEPSSGASTDTQRPVGWNNRAEIGQIRARTLTEFSLSRLGARNVRTVQLDMLGHARDTLNRHRLQADEGVK